MSGWRHPRERGLGESELSTNVYLSLVPVCTYNVIIT